MGIGVIKDNLAIVIVIILLISFTGCIGLVDDSQSTTTKSNDQTTAKNLTNIPKDTPSLRTSTEYETTPTPNTPNSSEQTPRDQNKSSGYIDRFEGAVSQSLVNVREVEKSDGILYVNYTASHNKPDIAEREVNAILQNFSEIVNETWVTNNSWNTEAMITTGFAENNSALWQFRTESWWAAEYASGQEEYNDYYNRTIATTEEWVVSENRPPKYGRKFISDLTSNIDKRTSVEVQSLDQHGGEAFLTYETDEQPGTGAYYAEVVNATNEFRELALPRRLDRHDGWYAGVLNVETRHENQTVEWYRYRIRWAEAVAEGELSREEELEYLLSFSRFENPAYDRNESG